jgi:serine/threonine protein kinase/Flp pilus assembly protein TadD
MALEDLTVEQWQRVDQELDRLIDLAPADREQALQKLATADANLAENLRLILQSTESTLDRPAVESMAELVESETGKRQDPAIGTRIGPYKLVEQLGIGGMGVVYLADRVDGHFEQQVALKIVRESSSGEVARRRFLAERQILAELEHPHIARLLDGGVSEDGQPYLAMEYVAGVPLEAYCANNKLGIRARLALFRDVCAAVDTAHRSLVVHRDLKSGNILVNEQGNVKVLDFGIAKWLDEERAEQFGSMTIENLAPLTPDSSAPEQLQGGLVTTATDVYALGVLLFRLLTEQQPFDLEGLALTERIVRLTEEEAPLPSKIAEPALRRELSGDLDQIVAMAMRKNPARRYASARELAADLELYLAGRPVLARPNSTSYRLGKFVRRNTALVVVATIALAALVGGLVAATWQARVAQEERTDAVYQATRAERISDSLVRVFADSNPYGGLGRVPTALDILDANVDRMRSEFADDPELQAELLLMMAQAYAGLGYTEPAEPLLLEAEAVHDSLYGAESFESAVVRLRRVSLLRRRGDSAGARALMPGIIAAYERETAPSSEERIAVYEAAANLATESGQYGVADSLSLMVLELRQNRSPVDEASLATSYTHRAVVLDKLGRTTEAKEHYARAIAIFENHPDERHNLSGALGNYAILLQNLGQLNEAASAQREAIRLMREIGMVFGDVLGNHLNTLGVILNDLGQYEESIPTLREAAAMNEEAGGRSGIRWLAVAMTLGTALTYSGEYVEAEEWLDAGVAGMEGLVGTGHLYYGVALSYRGILDRRAGRLELAREKLERSLSLMQPHLPTRARNTTSVLTELGEISLSENDLEQAEAYLVEAVRIAASELPAPDPFRALAVTGLGELRRRTGSNKEAIVLLEESTAALSEVRGADDAWTQLARERLANCAAGR